MEFDHPLESCGQLSPADGIALGDQHPGGEVCDPAHGCDDIQCIADDPVDPHPRPLLAM